MTRALANLGVSPRASALRSRAGRFGADRSGLAAVEMALAMPLLLTMALYGIEIAHMAMVNMQVSAVGLAAADNASRMEQTNNSGVTPTVTEADIDSIMAGAREQGTSISFAENGRLILSSLEKDSATGNQYIHWQRCTGELKASSLYGNGTSGNGISGMGRGPSKITALPGSAVMFVEVVYDYKGLFGDIFVKKTRFREEAAFLIRDIRNLTPGVVGQNGKSKCS